MNRGRRGEKIFEGKEDYRSFLEILEELAEVFNVNVSAYCLMSNHYHLLVKTPDANLSGSMRHLYTQRYNRRHGYDGPLFRGRYKSILVESDSYTLELVRYIHRNPQDFEEIPEAVRLAPDTDKIKLIVCRAYKINDDEPYASRKGILINPGILPSS